MTLYHITYVHSSISWFLKFYCFISCLFLYRFEVYLVMVVIVKKLFKRTTKDWQNLKVDLKFDYLKSNQLWDFFNLWGLLRKQELYQNDDMIVVVLIETLVIFLLCYKMDYKTFLKIVNHFGIYWWRGFDVKTNLIDRKNDIFTKQNCYRILILFTFYIKKAFKINTR